MVRQSWLSRLADGSGLFVLQTQVHAAINDRFVLNVIYQFNHGIDLTQFSGFNTGFTAGADKGVAYT